MTPSNLLSRLSILATFSIIIAFGTPISGQEVASQKERATPATTQASALNDILQRNIEDWILQRKGIPDDWSHRHLVFTSPGTEEESIANGTYDRWLAIVNDPRYILQEMKRDPAARRFGTPQVGLGTEGTAVDVIAPQQILKKSRIIKKDWSMDIGSSGTVGAGQFPAKFSFGTTTANCASASTPDFVIYNTGLAGSATQASIIAFFNLYSGCSTSTYQVPAVYWSYNTNGTILTSVILSLSGSQVAFVHSSGSNATKSSLVVLHWQSQDGVPTATGSAAAAPKSLTPSSLCTGTMSSCEYSVTFNTAANVTRSAPYYDYSSDALYVGDDLGVLHKFTPVFNGTPAEIVTGGWPLTVHSGAILTSPVADSNTQNIFVGDSSGRLSYVRDTGSTTGMCSSGNPPCIGSTTITMSTGPIADGPMIDQTYETVYAFSGVTSSVASYEVLQTNESLNTSSTPCSSNACPSITFTGVSGRTYTSNARIGAFDNIYYTTGPSSGHLYLCAPDNDGTSYYNGASLYEIGFNSSGVMKTTASTPLPMVSASPASGTTADDCSPLQEFYNGSTDYLFASAAMDGDLTGCTGSSTVGCLYNFNITSSFPNNSVSGLQETGNTSGIVIDNNASGGGSQIYFTNLTSESCAGTGTGTNKRGNGTGGCAIQASQSAP